jgi:hypothetical protein
MLSEVIGRFLRTAGFFIGNVSENNIITELPAEEAPKGKLIDLDLAKDLNGMPGLELCSSWRLKFLKEKVTHIGTTLESYFSSSYGCAFDMATKVWPGKNSTSY